MSGPIFQYHHEFCLARARQLSEGLRLDDNGLCRPSDIDNLLFVANHRRDISRMRRWPFTHQVEDMETMINLSWFFITSEMRTGKSKICVDAIQFLYEAGIVDKVIVVAPAPVRDVWFDDILGEINKHSFTNIPKSVTEYHAKIRQWGHGILPQQKHLQWIVTNFEFLRSKGRLAELFPFCGPKTLLLLDESSFVRTHDAQQTIACVQLRNRCGRVVLLNGTPLFHSPLDLFSQGNLLHPSILECRYITHFKAKYAIQEVILGPGGKALTSQKGFALQKISAWTNLEDLERRFKPYTVRRLQADCLDLPPKLDPVTLTATLTPETWRMYKEKRDDMVVWLKSGDVSVSATAATKVMRLSQITSGFLGGIEDPGVEDLFAFGDENLEEFGIVKDIKDIVQAATSPLSSIREIGREKLDVLLWFIQQRLEADKNLHLVTWGRFRPECFRTLEVVAKQFPQFEVAGIYGNEKRTERKRALGLLKPETSPVGPVFVAGIEGTGSFGLDMTAAHTCVSVSSGYSPGRSSQTLDRVYGPAQTHPIAYFNIMAVGPKGQRTIDHDIMESRMNGEDVAKRTAGAWVKALTRE